MGKAITEHDLRIMSHRVRGSMIRAGLIDKRTETRYEEGSKTYGRAWRFFVVSPAGGYSDVFHLSNGYLGSSRREAWLTMRGMIAAFDAVAARQSETVAS
jgi:hypothetical protein